MDTINIQNTITVPYQGNIIYRGDYGIRNFYNGFTCDDYDVGCNTGYAPGNPAIADEIVLYGNLWYSELDFRNPIIAMPRYERYGEWSENGLFLITRVWIEVEGTDICVYCSGERYKNTLTHVTETKYLLFKVDLNLVPLNVKATIDYTKGFCFRVSCNHIINQNQNVWRNCSVNERDVFNDIEYWFDGLNYNYMGWIVDIMRGLNYDEYGIVHTSLRYEPSTTYYPSRNPIADIMVAYQTLSGNMVNFYDKYDADEQNPNTTYTNPIIWSQWEWGSGYFYDVSYFYFHVPFITEGKYLATKVANYTWTTAEKNAASNI